MTGAHISPSLTPALNPTPSLSPPPQRFALAGGLLFIGANVRAHLERTTVSGSSFALRGGVAFLGPGAFVVLRQCSLSGGTAFRSGGALYASETAILALLDTALTGHSSAGDAGAIHAEPHAKVLALSSASGAGCLIADNAVDGTSGQGGAVFLESTAYFLFAGCTIRNCSAWEGGAVFSAGGSSGDNNYVQEGLSLLPSAAVRSLATDPSWAALQAPTVLFELFSDFYASGPDARGGVYVHWDVYGLESTIEGSAASDSAGGVFCGPFSHCACVGCALRGNSARFGGAWYVGRDAAQALFKGSIFAGNEVTGLGAALYAKGAPRVLLEGSQFRGNSAQIGGGAAFLLQSTVVATDTVFDGNSAAGIFPKGGAVYIADGSVFNATRCNFTSNQVLENQARRPVQRELHRYFLFSLLFGGAARPSGLMLTRARVATQTKTPQGEDTYYQTVAVERTGAGNGGAIFLRALPAGGGRSLCNLVLCVLSNNTAYQGGALSIGGDGEAVVRTTGTTFSGNNAPGEGESECR